MSLTRESGWTTTDDYGTTTYFNADGEFHREDGPAIERANGSRHWFRNGERHREDGPAVERPSGTREWWQNGQRHRIGGPAIELSNGVEGYFENGKRVRAAMDRYTSLPLRCACSSGMGSRIRTHPGHE